MENHWGGLSWWCGLATAGKAGIPRHPRHRWELRTLLYLSAEFRRWCKCVHCVQGLKTGQDVGQDMPDRPPVFVRPLPRARPCPPWPSSRFRMSGQGSSPAYSPQAPSKSSLVLLGEHPSASEPLCCASRSRCSCLAASTHLPMRVASSLRASTTDAGSSGWDALRSRRGGHSAGLAGPEPHTTLAHVHPSAQARYCTPSPGRATPEVQVMRSPVDGDGED